MHYKLGNIMKMSIHCLFQKHSQPPVSLEGQLLWREFYYTVATGTPNFDKMVGNTVCTQVDWDTNDEFLQAWKSVRMLMIGKSDTYKSFALSDSEKCTVVCWNINLKNAV